MRRTIAAPSGQLEIEDLGRERRIRLHGKTVIHSKLVSIEHPIDTPLSIETLRLMVETKGDWWLDEIERRSRPDYIRERLESLITRFGTLQGARVLDIGSGSGSSGLVMLDCGAAHVTGVEPDPRFVELAKRRSQDEGVADRAAFISVKDTTKLPFADEEFEVVTMNAVIEHLPLELRRAIVAEAYRCLKPGGLLVIDETPNRVVPYDGHTTGLPFIPWLPLPLAVAYARRFSRFARRGLSRDEYISEGIVGSTYWTIKRMIPGAKCLNAKGGDAAWKCSRKKCSPPVFFLLRAFERLLNLFGIPFDALLPSLDLVFQKPQPKSGFR